jgi:hypothetical protein
MKILLPDGQKIDLDETLSLDKKKKLVCNLTKQYHPMIRRGWNNDSIRFFLDGLANYLVWHKEPEDRNKQDKDVLSVKKVEEMEGKRKSKSIPFTSLSDIQREDLGFEGDSK